MRRIVRILVTLGVLAVLVAIIRRLIAERGDPAPSAVPWEPIPPDEADGPAGGWVDAEADGSCRADFPVKAKLASKIFHVPGGSSYDRTGADRCYRNEAAAEADGLRQAKR